MTRAGGRSPLAPRRTLPATVVDDTVAAAAILLDKWHPDEDSFGSSLFLDSTPDEVDAFLRAAKDLHRAMLFYASGVATTADALHAGGHGLIHAQELLDTAMRRLQRELQLLLTSLPAVLRFRQDDDDGEVDDDHEQDDDQSLMDTCAHLRVVAEAMMAAGYGKECVSIFKARRRAAVTANLQRLHGFSLSPQHAQVHKLSWEQVDAKIQSWLAGARVAFTSVFSAERELCDRVFIGDNEGVGDAVFGAIADDHATNILAVAEAAVGRARRAPERLFRVLDVHDALTETILPAIVSAFGEKSEVTSRAATLVTTKVSEAVRSMVASFEAAIEKEPSKGTVPGGAVHPLTRYVMNYLSFLADYENALAHIYFYQQGVGVGADQFTDTSSLASGSMGSSSDLSSSSSSSPALSVWSNPIGWLVHVLLRKLDAKAGSYREPALSYLFLANNTHYVAKKVGGGTKLERILGEEWAEAQMAKARGYVDVYVRAAWGSKVLRGGAVEEAVVQMVAMQEKWVAADDEMGEALRAAAKEAVVPMYRLFYRRQGAVARLTPGDVITMIDGLFGGRNAGAGDESVAAAGRRRSSQQQQQQQEVPVEIKNGNTRRQRVTITD
ncbi:hypothetical protein CFC21_023527 [Triticum aestivum]|uniref:Exocyst subunit Exo70 family protein n=2 Tax=Triticum aestivum TaxID=4565 RepID=A0A9R1J9G2_WHEAT|nr:exocyst complex component EXO70H1-like [Triticum aestivum]KAF7008874.1 hypothetical protein CFC21_023527 [Triticum aestivum]